MSTIQEKPETEAAPTNGHATNGHQAEQSQAGLVARRPRALTERVTPSNGHAENIGESRNPEITEGIEFRGAPGSFTFRGVK